MIYLDENGNVIKRVNENLIQQILYGKDFYLLPGTLEVPEYFLKSLPDSRGKYKTT